MPPEPKQSAEREPSRDELLAMAYADGELRGEDLEHFEQRLRAESGLAREVSEYKALQLLALQMAPPEPADYEWERIQEDFVHQAGERLGWLLFVGALLGLLVTGVIGVAVSSMPPLLKGLSLAGVLGFGLLLLMAARARIRTAPYDPYRKVER